MNTRRYLQILLASVVLASAGCQSFIKNATPAKIEANASDIYTFRVKVDENLHNVVPKSLWVELVINGETIKMKRDKANGKFMWSCDYPVPSTVSEVPYYFVAHYLAETNGTQTKEITYSTDSTKGNKPYTSIITNRYVIKIASSRSPVGATIAVVGQGFTETDKIIVGEAEAQSSLVSHSHINFIVPNLPVAKTYDVKLRTQDGDLSAGKLHIDSSTIGVQPSALNIKVGEALPVTFFIDSPAPEAGLTIDIVTDISACVVMPVVTIPAGQRSVSVSISGAQAGSGFLFISADGYDKAKVPVTVE